MLTANEAAERLSVKRATLYAYVSRGMLHSRRHPTEAGSYFDEAEVDALAARGRRARRGASAAPMESTISTIFDDQLYYWGHNAAELSRGHTFEEVAELLWQGTLATAQPFTPDDEVVEKLRDIDRLLPVGTAALDRLRVLLPVVAALDPMRHDLEIKPLVATTRRTLASLVAALPELGAPSSVPLDLEDRHGPGPLLAHLLWSRLSSAPPTPTLLRALNTALVVAADFGGTSHMPLVARLAASRKATIYSAIAATMETGSSPVRTSASLAIEAYLRNLNEADGVHQVLNDHLRAGRALPGFGHHSFGRDPRAHELLPLLFDHGAGDERVTRVQELLTIQAERGLPPPNLGFAIAMLCYVGNLVPGAGEVIFFVSRAAGWAAHAMDQYVHQRQLPPPAWSIARDRMRPAGG